MFRERRKLINTKVCLLGLFLVVFLIGGCATPAYKRVFNEKSAYNSKSFAADKDMIGDAVLRVMYANNFIIEKDDREKRFILAKRPFIENKKKTTIVLLQANVVSDVENKAILYLNAFETTERYYISDRTRFFLWLVPLPGGGGKNVTTAKGGDKLIEDKDFYQKFFSEIEKALSVVQASFDTEEVSKITQSWQDSPKEGKDIKKEETQVDTLKTDVLAETEIFPQIDAPEQTIPQ